MKESISYSFLLNIVIVFVFLCFAIIMGMFSYHKAFKANTIILSAIEKYEGYNCASKAEINKKLGTIGYNVPFTPTCKKDEKHCVVDDVHKYKVVSYNLDGPQGDTGVDYVNDITGTAYIYSTGAQTQHYRYAVTTYMYVDIPVVSQLMRMSVTTKTNTMYEFRDIYVSKDATDKYYDGRIRITKMNLVNDAQALFDYYVDMSTGKKDYKIGDAFDPDYTSRERAKYDTTGNGVADAVDGSDILSAYSLYTTYGTCENIKSYDNY